MPSFISKIVLPLSLIFLSSLANATLITNGSFEETYFIDNTTSVGLVSNTNLNNFDNKASAWDVFYELPGWITTYGNGIELQKSVVTQSQHGSHHVELDSHRNGTSNAVMTQTLESLIVGEDYLLEFYYKPRTSSANDNGINVFWYDSAIDFSLDMDTVLVADSTNRLMPNWALQSVSFTAQAQSMNLSFGSFGKQNTLGGLIDNVSLTQVASSKITSVPEPSMFLLFLTSIALLVVRQQKQVK